MLTFDSLRLASPYYNDNHAEWRSQLRKFVEREIMPHVDDWEEACDLPQALWHKAAEVGLLQLGYPEQYGGLTEGTDIFHTIIAVEELSRTGAGGIYATLMVHGIGLPPVVHFGSDYLKNMVIAPVLSGEKHISLAITEPGGGSDVANLSTSAVRDGDHYVLNGTKRYITNGPEADLFTVMARTDPDNKGAGGISAFIVERMPISHRKAHMLFKCFSCDYFIFIVVFKSKRIIAFFSLKFDRVYVFKIGAH